MNKIKAFLSRAGIRFIDDSNKFIHFWSIRVDILAAAFSGFLIAFPDIANDVWNQFPQDLKSVLPVQWTHAISIGLLVASMVARVLKQSKLGPKNESTSSGNDQPNNPT